MKTYRFSPIENKDQLLEAITYTHCACHKICKLSLNKYLPNCGNIGIFSHFDDEFNKLLALQQTLVDKADSFNGKYFRLLRPIIIPANEDIPETTYTYLYIRHPDPEREEVGDVDFYMDKDQYLELKQDLQKDPEKIKGAEILTRPDLDMIQLSDPSIDVLSFVATHKLN